MIKDFNPQSGSEGFNAHTNNLRLFIFLPE